ncbi:ribose 5-phosphate isomerase A [Fusarium mundagurra]|uniref:Ribose 5-phosphate isomerase A n=1 Tax=Fusarium mundagurra TaxID=1567541 RepID=A0A8H5YGD9_9HYPO|nr:ribose 5-phosphate isomerase A [Fusarium mundagurra]
MPCFVYINGYPGIGKLTIAKELQQYLPDSKVYHNHLLIDPIDALVERSSPGYHEMRTDLRRYVLNEIATSEYTKDITWVFTDARETSAAGEMGAKDYEAAASKRGVSFISIVLECEIEENIRRAINPTRVASVGAKLTDENILRPILEKETIYRFGNETELVLDVTKLSSKEAALRIKEHVDRLAACP